MAFPPKGKCRCGRSIPRDWPRCGECAAWRERDAVEDGLTDRMQRLTAIRLAAEHNRGVGPPVSPEIQALLAEGVSRLAQEDAILHNRRVRKAAQHFQLLSRYEAMRALEESEGLTS